MIFSLELAQAVLAGDKTVTRRRVKFNPRGIVLSCRYEVGRTYAIQPGRGKKAIGRIRIRDVAIERLAAVAVDYQAEGFSSFTAFKAYWIKLYGEFRDDQAVWRIEFESGGAL